ncbi:helix-turn-helix protein [Ulvibacter sp. MAR_2010_11]|uniref:helix-turn-helix domain-containing protein n=1 Tax=Ulvibacter sp. MAR_2010_11 TaxID=1250229 RepID=UPI000C2CA3D2|nr:helix-turn-helix domain-containing protein [Ulvibacter sp. MAR_2010_11]PKA82154.1 helix-turn-helix protein [Ulvibacter sp. MAR_2010_11]
MYPLRFFWIVLLVCATASAQKNSDFDEMLIDATHMLYSQPQQTQKIVEHVIQNSEDPSEIIKAFLLQGRVFYVSGEYEQAVNATLEAKKRAEATQNKEMQVEVNAFGIHMLNLLGLDVAAEKYYEFTEAVLTEEEIGRYNFYLDGGKSLLLANKNIEQENYDDALNHLKEAKSFFEKIPKPTLVNQTQILQSELYLKAMPLDAAFAQLNLVLNNADEAYPNDFQKMVVLNQLGEVYFLRKEYPIAITTLKEAMAISESISNKVYQYEIVEKLAVNYLALEDSENFYAYKKIGNELANTVEIDEENAVNSVFNYTNENHTSKRDQVSYTYKRNSALLGGVLALILLAWLGLKIRYKSRTRQYQDFIKYFEKRQKAEINDSESNSHLPKKEVSKSLNIPKETEEILIQKLDKFENSVHFTKQDMSLAQLASQFDTNTKYLSEIINTHKDKNFNSYINELRINYIIDKLKSNRKYLQYKISYLAEESGFSSHSSFATVFKSVTGIPPTVFIDILKSQKHSSKQVKPYEHAE